MAILRPEDNLLPHPLRDPSFSSYLDSAEQKFIKNLSVSVRKPYPDGKKAEDGEIDVFEAEKYFKGAIDDGCHHQQSSKLSIANEPDPHRYDLPRVQFGTPSIRSESSWNSSSVLLQTTLNNHIPPLPPQAIKPNKNSHLKSLISNLRCNYCSCNDKNSVQVDQAPKSMIHEKTAARDSTQSTPTSTHQSQSINKSRTNPWLIGTMPQIALNRDQEPQQQPTMQRKSLEVFGSPIERRFPMKSSLVMDDNQPSASTQDACMTRRSLDETHDETGSDASSDLFEIESFTTNTINTPRGYAPSEASVEWSVVTASMADFSALSDSEDTRTMSFSSNTRKLASREKNIPAKETERRRSGILLGCKSYKSVRVAGDAYRSSAKLGPNGCRMHHNSESRIGAEKKVAGFEDSRHVEESRSHSVHYTGIVYA